MEEATFFKHHNLIPTSRPFDGVNANTDTVFEEIMGRCRHPACGTFFGDAGKPSTSIVFGQRGSGKTALRLQMIRELGNHNRSAQHGKKVFVIEYVDFDGFHANFGKHLGRGMSDRDFPLWKRSDHIDSILSLGVTRYIADIIEGRQSVDALDRSDRRGLLNLALIYDTSLTPQRMKSLVKKLRFFWAISYPLRRWDCWFSLGSWIPIGLVETMGIVTATLTGIYAGGILTGISPWLLLIIPTILFLSFIPGWLKRSRRDCFISDTIEAVWVLPKPDTPKSDIVCQTRKHFLYKLWKADYDALKNTEDDKNRTPSFGDTVAVVKNRLAFFDAFREIIKKTGYAGITIIVDQVDEPVLISGSTEPMWAFIKSLFDNQLLQRPDTGFKLLLPEELYLKFQGESREFKDKARLDKQNPIKSLRWTGTSLIDLGDKRLSACSSDKNVTPSLLSLFEENIRNKVEVFMDCLAQPRRFFQFMNTVITEHLKEYKESNPSWLIPDAIFRVVKREFE